jgi:hypothetical protein
LSTSSILQDPAGLESRLAEALGVSEIGARPLDDVLGVALSRVQVLVLDDLAERGRRWLAQRLARDEVRQQGPARSTNQSIARLLRRHPARLLLPGTASPRSPDEPVTLCPRASVIKTSGPDSNRS